MEREKWGDLNKCADSLDEETLLNETGKSFLHLNYCYGCLSFPFSLPDM